MFKNRITKFITHQNLSLFNDYHPPLNNTTLKENNSVAKQ